MTFKTGITVILSVFVLCNAAFADTIVVTSDSLSIQAAIHAASDGDTILVAPGRYREYLNFLGKSIIVKSIEGPRFTSIVPSPILDPFDTFALVTFDHGETTDAVLEGFMLSGGWIAIHCMNSAATIRRNILIGQAATDWAAIALSGPGYPEWATVGWAPAVIENNTIIYSANGGISTFSSEAPVIKNNIIAFNGHYGIHREGLQPGVAFPDLSYNDVFGNPENYQEIPHPGIGSISADPLLTREFTLYSQSPCVDAGDPDPSYNDPDGTRNDMGALYCHQYEIIIPTNEWISIYCASPITVEPRPFPVGATIRAYDPDGVLCGKGRVKSNDGTYDFIPIYRDDVYTDFDEGAEPGDVITLTVDNMPAQTDPPLIWTQNGDIFEICSFSEERCMRIPLYRGWNLISWNVAYTGELKDLIADIEDCVDVVLSWSWDGVPAAYDPALDRFSTIDWVSYYNGYWFRMNCDAVLKVCGEEIPRPISDESIPWLPGIHIYPGWNIVGYWPREVFRVEYGFYSVLGVLEAAAGFDHGALIWTPDTPGQNTLRDLRPGCGYLVKPSEPAVIVYPGFEWPDTIMPPQDRDFAEGSGIPSRYWMSLYGEGIELDGAPLRHGDLIEIRTGDGVLCGNANYTEDILKFTPVYGYDDMSDFAFQFPKTGEKVSILVNGIRTYPEIEWSGNGSRTRIENLYSDEEDVIPKSYALSQNYPNPFNPGTMIKFELPAACHVRLTVYNIKGQKVRTLADAAYPAGRHKASWDGLNDRGQRVSTGIYLYHLETPAFTEAKKMLLMK